jgi:hypothetical protein
LELTGTHWNSLELTGTHRNSTDAVITFPSAIPSLEAFSGQIEPMEPAALEELWKQAKEEDPVYLTTLKVNNKVGLSYWKQLYNGCPKVRAYYPAGRGRVGGILAWVGVGSGLTTLQVGVGLEVY